MKAYRLRRENGTLCPSTYQTKEEAEMASEFLWQFFGKDYQVIEVVKEMPQ